MTSFTTEEFEYVLKNLNTVSHTSCIAANLSSSLRARERTIGRFPFRLRHRCLKRAAAPRCSWQQTTSWRWSGCQLSVFFFYFKNPNHFLYLLLTIIFKPAFCRNDRDSGTPALDLRQNEANCVIFFRWVWFLSTFFKVKINTCANTEIYNSVEA